MDSDRPMTPEEEQQWHQQMIAAECNAVKSLLLTKNADYGSSFAHPIGIFARGLTAEQQIGVRIDDKLQRILTGRNEISEDTELDLIGYLVLRRVLRRFEAEPSPPADVPECGVAFDPANPGRLCIENVGHSGRCNDMPF